MALESSNPIAQSFTVKTASTEGLPGVYLTKIGVYFKSKSSTAGAYLAVVECNNGVPNTARRVGSAFKISSDILISDDSSAETQFEFDVPLMLQTDKEYAFYVYPEFTNTDYEMWVSEVGGVDKVTGQSITQQAYSGVLYISSNGTTWNAVQTQDMKFNLYVAQFPISDGTIVFRNAKTDFITLDLTSASGGIYRKSASNPIQVGDIVYAANATSLSSILTTNNSIYPVGYVKYINEVTGTLYIGRSNGWFSNTTYRNIRFYRTPDYSNTSYITSTYLIANAIIQTVDDIPYNAVVPKYKITEPSGTYIETSYYGTSNTTYTSPSTKDTLATNPHVEDLYEFRDYERVIRSYSNERAAGSYGTKGTSTYQVRLLTNSRFLSPVIDLYTKSFDYIKNVINNDDTNEYTRYGSGKSKYISKTVVLDTVAEDIRIYVTGYRPVGTNIKVYVKALNSQVDATLFDSRPWTELEYLNNGSALYSSPRDYEDYKEYVFGVSQSTARPTSPVNTIAYQDPIGDSPNGIPPGILTYYSEDGVQYRGFDMFSIKILLMSSDGVNYPSMRDVRAVALQM
jgi:hypothetical protein